MQRTGRTVPSSARVLIADQRNVRLCDPDRPWIGCWRLRLEDSVRDLERELLLRLDSTPTYRGHPRHYYGRYWRGSGGAETAGASITWASPAPDSISITIGGLG